MRATLLIRAFCGGSVLIILLYSLKSWLGYIKDELTLTFDLSPTRQPFQFQQRSSREKMQPETKARLQLRQKVVHLDLKGSPPRLSYLEELFPLFQKLGVTALLVEYEDMFPYYGTLASVASPKAYTRKEIAQLNHLAKQSNLKVIPLIQTFGHLEFVLKLEEYSELREVPRYPQVLCPSDNRSMPLVETMIDQVLSLHPDVTHFHIGSDEVYYLGLCSRCIKRMSEMPGRTSEYPKAELFLRHAKAVADYVTHKHRKRVMMWDDEFRQLEDYIIRDSGLGDLVDIVVWHYRADVEIALGSALWKKYRGLFQSIWIASAFKGADRPDSMVVREGHYLANHVGWLQTLEREELSVEGIVITGWQRYDHFAILCEILAVAIPSLIASLTLLNEPDLSLERVLDKTNSYLQCQGPLAHCSFPGSRVYEQVRMLQNYKAEVEHGKNDSTYRGWAHPYINLQSAFSSPAHIETILSDVGRLEMELSPLRRSLERSLSELYPEWVTQEWLLTHFEPTWMEVQSLATSLRQILDRNTFPVRPPHSNESDSFKK